MEFDFDGDEEDSVARSAVSSNRRRRPQEDDASIASITSTVRISVKGAGKSALAQQDAGSYQMLHDECSDLCSTILATESLDAAMDLALLLANRKTRSVLWQGDTQNGENEDEDFAASSSSLWNSILSVLTCYRSSKKKKKIAGPSSPSRSRSRTKSARRKEKMLQMGGSTTSNSDGTPSSELKQVLSCLLSFLSWDCTLSQEHSVASMGSTKSPQLARKVRTTILQHEDALQGAVQLFLSPQKSSNNKNPFDMESVLSSASSSPISVKQPRGKRRWGHSPACDGSLASIASTVSSVSFEEAVLPPSEKKDKAGDPTAAGRRKRRKRRLMQPIAEDDEWKKIVPPPQKKVTSPDFSFASDSFPVPQSPKRSAGSSLNSDISARMSPKLTNLISKVMLSEEECSGDHIQQDMGNWISMVCLQSLNRIINGKDKEGTSCIERTDDDDDDDTNDEEEEERNPILITNNLLAKSGVVPLLAKAMSESLEGVTKLLATKEESCWQCWNAKLSILASLIDGACLFHGANRRAFCEEDPFSFEECNQGLILHIILMLHQFSKPGVGMRLDDKISGIVLLGLRTLTSLTHENEVPREQMIMCNNNGEGEEESIRGLDVLAELVFELEEKRDGNGKKVDASHSKEEDLHRYDSTIFCLNILANIVEGENVRRLLAEIKVPSPSGEILWIKWLCQWLVTQTASFRDAILGIGKKNRSGSEQRELQKNEEDKLVAAGNGCVLLACLMTEPDSISEEPESTNTIRNLIIGQMPVDRDGSSTGVTMIVNTLKAFCNFYHYSLGGLSVAIVAPVKKLIQELEEMEDG